MVHLHLAASSESIDHEGRYAARLTPSAREFVAMLRARWGQGGELRIAECATTGIIRRQRGRGAGAPFLATTAPLFSVTLFVRPRLTVRHHCAGVPSGPQVGLGRTGTD